MKRKRMARRQTSRVASRPARIDFASFQKESFKTSHLGRGSSPQQLIAPVLGLASETGSILDICKKYLRDRIDSKANREFLKEELGDLLWYVSTVAKTAKLELEDIARFNIERTRDLYPRNIPAALAGLPVFDPPSRYPAEERFPRRLEVSFTERKQGRRVLATLKLTGAEPKTFPNGPFDREIDGEVKRIGFLIGQTLGDPLTDNSRRADSYRYHDAIHMGFMAVLGWSPIWRDLLGIKRRSDKATNEVEDGARARYLEEGLSAVLAALSERRLGFRSETTVDGDSISVAKALTANCEARELPGWAWKRAIHQGFAAMHQLGENRGGYLIADLKKRTLTYKRTP